MKPTVYLAGPITGGSYKDATGWRGYVSKRLSKNIHPLSPMRHKEYLLKEKELADGYDDDKKGYLMSSIKAITTRDRFDSCRCTILFVNLNDATRVSIGSMLEIGWADANRIPIIVVMGKENIHYHGMVRTIAGWVVPTLDDGIEVVNRILA